MPRKELVESLVRESLKKNENGELVLDLTNVGITRDDLRFVLSGLKAYQATNQDTPPLSQLLLRGNDLGGSAQGIIAIITTVAKDLKYLDVNGCKLQSPDILDLTHLLQSTNLVEMNINGNKLEPDYFRGFKEYLADTKVKRVKMPGKCEKIEQEVLQICADNRKKSKLAVSVRRNADEDNPPAKRLAEGNDNTASFSKY